MTWLPDPSEPLILDRPAAPLSMGDMLTLEEQGWLREADAAARELPMELAAR